MQLLNNFLLIHTHGPNPSGMLVHAQLPELSRAVPMAEGPSVSKLLEAWLIITEKLRWFIHDIEKRNNGLKSREI